MSLYETSKTFVNQFYKKEYNPLFLFHNFGFVLQLVTALEELLSTDVSITEQEKESLQVALLFHQIGYYKDFENAGATSILVTSEFLKAEKVSEENISLILSLMKVTNTEVKPKTTLEAIMHDAAFSFLAFKNFEELTELLKAETELTQTEAYTRSAWHLHLQKFFKTHQFHTAAAQKNWSYRFHSNLLVSIKATAKKNKKKNKSNKNSPKKADKGRDTIFRTTLRNHISLSDNADRKAHIILTVNSIVISIIFSRIFPKLDNPSNTFLYVPSLVFLGFTVASIILSIIATRPRITVGTFTKEQVKNKNVNLLFFGNFYRMKIQEFEWAMEQLLNDDEYIYKSLSKDLYYLGKVVAKKYRILQVTYAVFMIGIIVSSILYIVYFNMYN